MKKLLIFFLSLQTSISSASSCSSNGPNVILLTLDGVRSQEFFKGTNWLFELGLPRAQRREIFSRFWSRHAQEGVVLGGGKRFRIGSPVSVSLPSYQAMMLGEASGCRNNDCPAIQEPSVLEHLKDELGLRTSEVAVFASWNRMSRAVARRPASITTGIFPGILDDGSDDPILRELQDQGMEDLPPWEGSRKDHYTFELGMHYLQKHCPRLLYISLVDADELAHDFRYGSYVRSLRTYDGYVERMIETLQDMGEYGKNTTLILTTDHSRGNGPLWAQHNFLATSKNVFLFGWGRGVRPQGRNYRRATQLQLRPTIEHLMGARPTGKILPGFH